MQKSNKIVPKNIFVLGTAKRSGTNFLKNMLCLHEDCFSPGPIWEDFLLEHIGEIDKYVNYTTNRWNVSWNVEEVLDPKNVMKEKFGDALLSFLRSQFESDMSVQRNIPLNSHFITKTPSTENIENFFNYFPNSYLLVITRDGRSVAESAGKSFNKPFDIAIREWDLYAEKVVDLLECKNVKNRKLLIIKYEDLHRNTKDVMRKIIDFLDLDEERYDYEKIKTAPVIGSSDLGVKGDLHWKPMEKKVGFNPEVRWGSWSEIKHQRYNWVAGKNHKKLGYKLKDTNRNFVLNVVMDIFWRPAFKIWCFAKIKLYMRMK
ncbi:MAG: hypothetical protein ACJAUP_000717 [Cellvibrionaceae bacterium]|jgi:hypothetical protein